MNDHYHELYSSYQWLIPTQFNIAQACLYQWALNPQTARQTALIVHDAQQGSTHWSFLRLAKLSNQLANGLLKIGIEPGDRVAIAMGQRPETIAAYMASLAVGAVVLPLAASWSAKQIEQCLLDARCRLAITDLRAGPDVLEAQKSYTQLSHIIGLGFQHERVLPWRTLLIRQSDELSPIKTNNDTPALLLYNVDTSNQSLLGAVLPHKALIGNLPGFVASQNWFAQQTDCFWTSADWCSLPGLLSGVLPALYFGKPVVTTLGQPEAKQWFSFINEEKISNVYLSPDFLDLLLQQAKTNQVASTKLRAIAIEAGHQQIETFEWCQQNFGFAPNPVVGQNEINQFLVASSAKWGSLATSWGRPVPGHQVAVLNNNFEPCQIGQSGVLAVNRVDATGYPNPALFLSYWADATEQDARYKGSWFLTDSFGTMDDQGFFYPQNNPKN